MTALMRYDAARRALAEARSVDEVKDIRDQAVAMAEYARRANNHEMEADAVAIRLQAARKLGQLMQAQKESVGLNRGAAGGGKKDGARGVFVTPRDLRPTLASQGIDKNLAKEARRLGALSAEGYAQTEAEVRDAIMFAERRVVKSITLPKDESAASEAELQITILKWNTMSAAEQAYHLDPANFPSNVKLNAHDTEGTDYARNSYSTVVGCKHPCEILCWAHDVTERFSHRYPHGFFNPVFRPHRLNAPRNTAVPAEAESDGRFKNVSSNFMSDMFGGWVPSPWIEATLAVERADPRWNFLHLTKFPQRLIKFDLPPNGWFGTTVDWQVRVPNAEDAFAKLRERYPDLIFFLSIEPMFEQLKFTQLNLFNFIIIGGAARSMRTPEWRPPHRWIMDLIEQADRASTSSHRIGVFEKTNLHGNRILELPFDAPIKHEYPQVAPDVFHYLRKKQD